MDRLLFSIALLLVGCTYNTLGKNLLDDDFHEFPEKSEGIFQAQSEGPHSATYADWDKIASDSLQRILNDYKLNLRPARNVIFFLGDGMGVSTETTARLHQAQEKGITLDKSHLAWDSWLDNAQIKTYNTDASPPDSAGTATAFLCGKKTRIGTIGVDQSVEYKQCESMTEDNYCTSNLHHAIDQGKWTGIITTTRITHATPAAAYAHSPARGWETFVQVPDAENSPCQDIAKQLVYDDRNKNIKVLFGGGRAFFMDSQSEDPEYPGVKGYRPDTNLINDWLLFKKQSGLADFQYSYIHNLTQFNNLDPETTDYVLGLFEPSHLQYELDRPDDGQGEPHIADMTEKAIRVLSRSPEGFFLLVEGGRIDHGHHQTKAKKALADTIAFSEAVERAISLTDEKDTLIVVSADHSHTFTMGGYSHIDTPLYGPVHDRTKQLETGLDGVPYLKLSYANGPGIYSHRTENNTRKDVTKDDSVSNYEDRDYVEDTIVPLTYETHSSEDVSAHALGPWAHLFKGVQEQNYIAHAIQYSACLGPYSKGLHCRPNFLKTSDKGTNEVENARFARQYADALESGAGLLMHSHSMLMSLSITIVIWTVYIAY